MIRAKNYEKLSKFVKVTAAETLSVLFFRTRCTFNLTTYELLLIYYTIVLDKLLTFSSAVVVGP